MVALYLPVFPCTLIILYWSSSIGMIYSIVLTCNNSYWVFSGPEKQLRRFAMASRSKSSVHLPTRGPRRTMWSDVYVYLWVTHTTKGSIDNARRLDADQWCVRQSMRSPTVNGKKFCRRKLFSATVKNCQNNRIVPARGMKISHINTRGIHLAYEIY
jgi:hypothetical protein